MTQQIKIAKACEELGITRQSLYNWKNKGLLNFTKNERGNAFIIVDELYQKLKIFYEYYRINRKIT